MGSRGKGEGVKGKAKIQSSVPTMKAKIRTFEDLIVWQRAIALVKRIYVITDEGGLKRDFGLKDQLRRAALSI